MPQRRSDEWIQFVTNTKANTIMVGEDRISKLPDEILTHILCFLPTKDAVGTSVLSKRWSDLWTFMINLDFDDRLLYSHKKATATERQHFVNFVDTVLQRLSSSCINGVTLCLSASDNDAYHPRHHINAWISAFLRRRVQKLFIRYNQTVLVDFCALFHSNSLVELDLKLLSNVSIVPSNSCLANLQILNVSRMTVVEDNFQSKEMVLNFPVLKVFTAINCTWLHVNEVILNTPLLESFSITSSFLKNAQGPPFSEPQNTAIKIFAPHLKKFLYNGQLLEEIILSDPLSILHVFLEIQHCGIRDDWHQTVAQACLLLKEFHRVETLQLGNSLVTELCHPYDQLSALPMFGRLVFLKLDLDYKSHSQQVLLNLLPKSPNLQRLVFFCVHPKFDRELLTSKVPPCLVSSLKVIEIYLGSWGEENVFLVKYMLEKAQALQQLTINLCMEKEVDVKNVTCELLSYSKASENISIKVKRTTGKRSRK